MKNLEDFMKEHGIENLNLNSEKLKNSIKSNDNSSFNVNSNDNCDKIGELKNKRNQQRNIKLEERKTLNKKANTNKYNTEKYKELEEFDVAKTKVLRYVLYKKRTEQEVRQKFSSTIDENLLEDVIQNLIDNGYISDENYTERAVNEFLAIKTLSIKEIRMKLYAKGIDSDTIDTYFSNHQEQLEEYEIACAKKIIIKKRQQMEDEDIESFLYKKGYKQENIKLAFENVDE